MCSRYQGLRDREKFRRRFGIEPPPEALPHDIWLALGACFIRWHEHALVGDEAVPAREALPGIFGLVPHWAKDTTIARHTYNARSETIAEKPSLRDAWKRGQHCIIPADAFFEPDWRSGRAVPTRIAGLWTCWRSPQGSASAQLPEAAEGIRVSRPVAAGATQEGPGVWAISAQL